VCRLVAAYELAGMRAAQSNRLSDPPSNEEVEREADDGGQGEA